jgi:pilus assembly protein CpaE
MRTLIISPTMQHAPAVRLRDFMQSSPGCYNVSVISYTDAEDVSNAFDLYVVCLAHDSAESNDLIRRLREKTEARIVTVGPITNSKFILRILQLGADLFLDQNDPELELVGALNRLFPKLSGALPTGRIIAFMSASGGCGASTLAVNYAAVVARNHGKCGLLDLHPGRGDLHSLLDLKLQFNLGDACQNESRFDRAMLEKMLVRHECGIHLLASSTGIDEIRALTPTGVGQVVSQLHALFANTVIDLEDCVHTEQIEALKQTGLLFLVCCLDFTSMRRTRHIIDHLKDKRLFQGVVKVVANKQGQPGELSLREAMDALGTEISAVVPYDPESINAANNTGVPVVLKSPEAIVAQAIKLLVRPVEKKRLDQSGFLARIKNFVWPNLAKTTQPHTATS